MLLQTKEEGKALLRTIAQKRNQQEEGEMQVCLFVINPSQASVLLHVIWNVDYSHLYSVLTAMDFCY